MDVIGGQRSVRPALLPSLVSSSMRSSNLEPPAFSSGYRWPCTSRVSSSSVLGRARGQAELLLKEALHIQMTSAEEHFSQKKGLEVPGCWTALMMRQEGRSAGSL